jgi:hypothetical protein
MLSWFPSAHLSALAGGLFLAVLSTIIIPATFFMTKAITQNKEAAFNAASLITLMPSLILFFPEFDQVFPIFTCVLLGLWAYVLRNNKLSDSFLFGIALSVTLFFTWSVLVTGAFLVMLTVYQSVKNKGQAPLRIKEHLIMSFGVLAAFYFILWKITGFNVFDTFLQCLALEGELIIDRPYPYTIFYGFTDFLLGAGWIPLILGGIFIWGKRQSKDQSFWVSIFCYSQVLLVAVLNFFPAETARVEMFLLPIFIIPAAFALLNVSFKDKMIVHGCQIVLLGVIAQNMRFIN